MNGIGRGAAMHLPLLLLATVSLAIPHRVDADEWLRHDTDTFQIVYRAEDADAAARVAELAPSVWARTTDFLQYEPSKPIPVVIYGETARANGFFTPYPPHVSLFVAAPAGPWMGARTEDWLETVFVHEVVHYLHLMQPIGFFGTASRVFGPLAAAGGTLFLPGWALEGPTTTAETILTSGGRGRNPYFEMEWVAPILAGEMYSYDQAGFASAYPPLGRIYSAGYLLTDHLLREYGEDAFIELNREFQRWPFLGMRRAVRRTTGVSGPQLHQEMVAELTARYAGRRDLPSGHAISAPDRDKPDPLAQRYLLSMTDRGAVALHRSPFDPGSIQLLTDDGSWRHLAAVTPLDEYSVAVSGDGAHAAAVVQRANRAAMHGGPYVNSGDLYLIDLHEGDYRRVTSGARLFHPALEEAGATVIAVERTGRFSRLVSVDTETGHTTPVYAPPGNAPLGNAPPGAFLSMPALSRDGRHIAVVENTRGRQSIVILRRDQADTTQGARAADPAYTPVFRINVGNDRDAEYRPRFTASGEVWFVADAGGLLQLYRTELPQEFPSAGQAADAIPTIELILTDQVGVISGFSDATDGILYGTYRSSGYTVRRGSATPRLVEAAAMDPVVVDTAEPRGIAPGSHGRAAIISESHRYWDLPRPVLWIPTVDFTGDGSGADQFALGAGLIAASNLGRHNLQAFAAYDPTNHIPSGSLAYTYVPGATSLTLSAASTQEDSQRIAASVSRPLWYDENATHYRGVAARAGGAYQVDDNPEPSQTTSMNGAVRLLRYRYAGRGQIFGGTGGAVQTGARYRPQFLDQADPDLATLTTASLRLGRRTGQIRLIPLTAITTSNSGAAVENLPWRAPVFTPAGIGALERADTALYGSVTVAAAAQPLDAAWRGVSLRNVGSRL